MPDDGGTVHHRPFASDFRGWLRFIRKPWAETPFPRVGVRCCKNLDLTKSTSNQINDRAGIVPVASGFGFRCLVPGSSSSDVSVHRPIIRVLRSKGSTWYTVYLLPIV